MLILECVEQKKECRGPKWGGLLPISSLGSRHYSGVATGGTAVCTAGAPACTTKDLRSCASVPGKAYCDRPTWVLCCDILRCSLATERKIFRFILVCFELS